MRNLASISGIETKNIQRINSLFDGGDNLGFIREGSSHS